jgi:hypothetical protein
MGHEGCWRFMRAPAPSAGAGWVDLAVAGHAIPRGKGSSYRVSALEKLLRGNRHDELHNC